MPETQDMRSFCLIEKTGLKDKDTGENKNVIKTEERQ